MKYIYYCPTCRKIMAADHKYLNDVHFCNSCKNECVQTGYTFEEWDSFPKNTQKELVKIIIKEYLPDSKFVRFGKLFGMIALLVLAIEGVTYFLGPSFTLLPVIFYFGYLHIKKDYDTGSLRKKMNLDERVINEKNV